MVDWEQRERGSELAREGASEGAREGASEGASEVGSGETGRDRVTLVMSVMAVRSRCMY